RVLLTCSIGVLVGRAVLVGLRVLICALTLPAKKRTTANAMLAYAPHFALDMPCPSLVQALAGVAANPAAYVSSAADVPHSAARHTVSLSLLHTRFPLPSPTGPLRSCQQNRMSHSVQSSNFRVGGWRGLFFSP